MFARDLEELVNECVEMGTLIVRGWRSLLEQLFDEQVDEMDAAGEMMRNSIARALRTFRLIEDCVAKVENDSYNIEKSSSFRNIARELQEIQAEFERTWPRVNDDLIERSQAAYRRGEYRTTEELLGESQSCSPESH